MLNRFGGWWRLWMTLIVLWAIVVIAYGWMNLPRAQQMPHNPQFPSKLSIKAAAILYGTEAKVAAADGGLIWTDTPLMVRMSNGVRLAFPAATSRERVALVSDEYTQLLDAEAGERRGRYMLGLAAVWLLPGAMLLLMGMATGLIHRDYKPLSTNVKPRGYAPEVLETALAPHANCNRLSVVLGNEQTKPRARARMAAMVERRVISCQRNSVLRRAVERRQSKNFLGRQPTLRT